MRDLQEFIERVELERQLLAEVVPYLALRPRSRVWEFEGAWRTSDTFRIELSNGSWQADRLRSQLLPLFFAAGWKVLDSLAEYAIGLSGGDIPRNAAQRSKTLVEHSLPLPPIPAEIWRSAVWLYSETRELRNSLMHRTARVRGGVLQEQASRPEKELARAKLTSAQQKYFCELIQLLAGAVEKSELSDRELRECRYLLWELRSVHRQDSAPANRSPIVRVRYHLGSDRVLPVENILKHVRGGEMNQAAAIDLELVHDATVFRGELEDVSDAVVIFDPESPPSWLQRMLLPAA